MYKSQKMMLLRVDSDDGKVKSFVAISYLGKTPEEQAKTVGHHLEQYRGVISGQQKGAYKRHPLDGFWRLVEDCEGALGAVRGHCLPRAAAAAGFVKLCEVEPTFLWVVNELLERGLDSLLLAQRICEGSVALKDERLLDTLSLLKKKIAEKFEDEGLFPLFLNRIPEPEARKSLIPFLELGASAKKELTVNVLRSYGRGAKGVVLRRMEQTTVAEYVLPESSALQQLLAYGDPWPAYREAVYALAVTRDVLDHIGDLLSEPALSALQKPVIARLVFNLFKKAHLNQASSIFFFIESLEVVIGRFTSEAISGAQDYLEWVVDGRLKYYNIIIWGLIVCLIELLESVEGAEKERLIREFFAQFLQRIKELKAHNPEDPIIEETEKAIRWALERLKIHPQGCPDLRRLFEAFLEVGSMLAGDKRESVVLSEEEQNLARQRFSSLSLDKVKSWVLEQAKVEEIKVVEALTRQRLRKGQEVAGPTVSYHQRPNKQGKLYWYAQYWDAQLGKPKVQYIGKKLPPDVDPALVTITRKTTEAVGNEEHKEADANPLRSEGLPRLDGSVIDIEDAGISIRIMRDASLAEIKQIEAACRQRKASLLQAKLERVEASVSYYQKRAKNGHLYWYAQYWDAALGKPKVIYMGKTLPPGIPESAKNYCDKASVQKNTR